MKTSWIETKENEDYLFGNFAPAQHLLFSAELLIDPERLKNLRFQKETNELVRLYSRKKLKEEIEAVHEKLFKEKGFRERIVGFFKKRL